MSTAFAPAEPLAAAAGAEAAGAGVGVKPTRLSGEALVALPPAGFWIRMLALSLDALLVGLLMLLLIHGSFGLFLILLAAYGVVMWSVRGSTVGGIICNLALIKQDGHEVDWGTAAIRALGAFVSFVVIGLGFIWIAIDPEKRSWHDKIAGTIVVRVP
jgi:uncharacterized RDD family membrane protein YckC